MTDPWRSGQDPTQRILRAAAVVVTLAVFGYLALDGRRRTPEDIGIIALALAVTLILLGYESLIRLPWIGRRKDDD